MKLLKVGARYNQQIETGLQSVGLSSCGTIERMMNWFCARCGKLILF